MSYYVFCCNVVADYYNDITTFLHYDISKKVIVMNLKLNSWLKIIVILCFILLVVFFAALLIGSVSVSWKDLIDFILKGKKSISSSIVFDLRLPRIILAFAIGSALSLAGVILQGMFRNPLVEPYTLGLSGGAAFAVALAIVLGLTSVFGMVLPIAGFIGALGVFIIIYMFNQQTRSEHMHSVLLVGVMLSFISSALIMLLMAVSKREDLQSIVFWIMGSLEQASPILIGLVFFIGITGLIISYLFTHDINAMALGEEDALHLGINTKKTKQLLLITASILTGISVSIAGVIGFVGLLVPHLMRMFVGEDHRILLVSSFLCGGIFLIFCDTLARTIIAPIQLPVGVITGIIGGSVFVVLLSRPKTKD